jgi:predicted alpha/beta-fold hydrolase
MSVLPLRPYATPFWLRNGHLQTFLASSGFRARGSNRMREAACDVILEAGGGIRLLGSHSRHPGTVAKGLVVLLHGWEGSIGSTYMLCTGRALYRRGYEVFRLNFRDHGRSHHLNRGIFYAVLLDEVFEAGPISGLLGEDKFEGAGERTGFAEEGSLDFLGKGNTFQEFG